MMEKTTGDAPLLLTLSFKRCSCCGEVKPTTDFTRYNRQGKWGFQYYCKACVNKKRKQYKLDNPENIKRANRKHNLKKQYGLTIEDVEKMLKNQNYKCMICGRELFLHGSSVDKSKIARVDHNHETGEIRGLLCSDCNRGIGLLKDNPLFLANAIKYLENAEKVKKLKNEE